MSNVKCILRVINPFIATKIKVSPTVARHHLTHRLLQLPARNVSASAASSSSFWCKLIALASLRYCSWKSSCLERILKWPTNTYIIVHLTTADQARWSTDQQRTGVLFILGSLSCIVKRFKLIRKCGINSQEWNWRSFSVDHRENTYLRDSHSM